MKRTKKLLSLFTALAILGGSFLFAAPALAAEETDFVPVLRFIAASDTHVRDDNDVTADRIGKMLDLAYRIADSDPAYTALDAVLIAGDLTNDGTKTEFDKFTAALNGAKREDTRFLGVVAKNHDGYEMPRAEMRDYYTKDTGNDPDFHVVINGYHFIGVSASTVDLQHYDPGQIFWLKNQLDAAVAEAPDRPVFVTHHEHVRDTVYGSSQYDGWGVTHFSALLKKYPQVVDFSGHSHYPLNDPRSVWQGAFTAIGTGAIYYSEFTVDKTRTYHPADSNDTATCWIVEVDEANRLRLRGMDVEAGECLCEYILDNPADPANRNYTPAKRKETASAPVFTKSAKIAVTPTPGGCAATAPRATSTDGMPVVLYRIRAVDAKGKTVAEDWTLPCYYRAVKQTEIELALTGLEAGEYTVTVTAENAYGMESTPLSAKVTVDDGGCPYCHERHEGFFGPLVLFFHRVAFFFSRLFGKA